MIFSNQVAIVTGAGGGLGRSHAILLAKHGAKVVVNDLNLESLQSVVHEIETRGGTAIPVAGSVTETDAVATMVAKTLDAWGQIDILINNAGILRDKTFAKLDLEDFKLVIDVHLMGAVNCTKAVWEHMRQRQYGRIIMTTSAADLYGNFGQSNYGAAKMALVGFMKTIALEGARYSIRVNCLAPTAATQMVEGLMPQEELNLLQLERVSPAVIPLASPDTPTGKIICAGAGAFAAANVTLTKGIYLREGVNTSEQLVKNLNKVLDRSEGSVPVKAENQGRQELALAGLVMSRFDVAHSTAYTALKENINGKQNFIRI